MKRSDTGDFCVLYVELGDEKSTLFRVITGQKKPVVIMLSEQARAFQRPEDFTELKHVKRQLDRSIIFVIPSGERIAHLASRNGFPVYLSMDALAKALSSGQVRQRTASRTTLPLHNDGPVATLKRTVPLQQMDDEITRQRTAPLPPRLTDIPVPPPQSKRQQNRISVIFLALILFALLSSGIGTFIVFSHKLSSNAAAPALVGRVAFLSSNQLSENSNQGINDKVLIDLNNISTPAPGKNYYAWLLADKKQNDTKAIFLGTLHVNNGHVQMVYPGDDAHTNLLAITSRFLITEEDAAMTPLSPTPDLHAWRYYGEFAQVPLNTAGNTKHFSYLDHLRHLLATDPTLDMMELPGGLNTWIYRNTSKILEWTSSMREQWQDSNDPGFVRRQTIRVLAYLDGTSFVQRDLPANTPLSVNERLARVGLLEVQGENQDPACYLAHVSHHLYGLLQSGATPSQALRKDASDIVTALNNVKFWLGQVRQEGRQIVKMSDKQLRQPGTLTMINDMIDNATHAFVGQVDPATGEMRQGVIWIHNQMQVLATLNVSTFSGTGSSIQLIQDTKHHKALRPQWQEFSPGGERERRTLAGHNGSSLLYTSERTAQKKSARGALCLGAY